ncbi:hypothetical protein QJS04_geneDACA009045 [Acorus gramineus]|uniref:Glycolipid transfer protein domain-containing protein n=1 Tax=Acorus gramineus TaxID=55184 RepID=A0AAV9AR43_ACOGR|nr:hypothetical protein QJS04_geneDACA009045 [Acorus gramineus]
MAVKRKRGVVERGGSELRLAVDELSLLKSDGHNNTRALLSLSNFLLHVLDKIGPTMAVLRQDIHQNIERLEKIYESNPSIYSSLVEILNKEVGDGTAKRTTSCSRALLWLTRSMDFIVALLEKLVEDPEMSLKLAIEEAYENTLRPWHGWISSAAYKVALKLIPEREEFIGLLMYEGQDYNMLKKDIQSLISLLLPFLNDIHSTLRTFHLERLKSI